MSLNSRASSSSFSWHSTLGLRYDSCRASTARFPVLSILSHQHLKHEPQKTLKQLNSPSYLGLPPWTGSSPDRKNPLKSRKTPNVPPKSCDEPLRLGPARAASSLRVAICWPRPRRGFPAARPAGRTAQAPCLPRLVRRSLGRRGAASCSHCQSWRLEACHAQVRHLCMPFSSPKRYRSSSPWPTPVAFEDQSRVESLFAALFRRPGLVHLHETFWCESSQHRGADP